MKWSKKKGIRDNLHVADLVAAFWEFFHIPTAVWSITSVANFANCSVTAAVMATELIIDGSRRRPHLVDQQLEKIP
jgi:hypothetical protein